MMCRFFAVLLAFAVVVASAVAVEPVLRPASPAEIALLKEAMKDSAQDTEHWAYTETTIIRDKKGTMRDESVVRFDPSKPYAEQYTPLKIDGQPPTERQLKKYRKEGEKRGRQLRKAAESQEKRNPEDPPHLSINDDKAVLDLARSSVVQEEADRMTLEIPLRAEKGSAFPVEKFEILVQVGKSSRQVERVWFRVKESFRLALVAKVRKGEAMIDFTRVDPNFGPVMTSLTGDFGVSFFFIPFNATVSNTHTEWRRVQAYDERFSVKMAPLQLLGF